MLPQEKIDAQSLRAYQTRLLLRPFGTYRIRAVVAIHAWFAEYCIQFWLFTYAFAMPADFEFPREKVLRLTEQKVG